MVNEEKQMCPRRKEHGSNSVFNFPETDKWETDRWSARESDIWKWEWKPRTCSFCGSIHPEDAIKLLKEGWEIEATGKGYKRYLEPPGYKKAMEKLIGNVRQRNLEAEDNPFDNNETWSPTPPVKLYTMHFDQEERNLFNIEINKRKKNKE